MRLSPDLAHAISQGRGRGDQPGSDAPWLSLRQTRGLVDTSVVIDLDTIDPAQLPSELAISAITLAELAAGPHATRDSSERARRQDRLQRTDTRNPADFAGLSGLLDIVTV